MEYKNSNLIVVILAFAMFAVLNTEMGIVGIIPEISKFYHVNIAMAGNFVSLFAVILAFTSVLMPLLFSRFSRKKVIILSLVVFSVFPVLMAVITDYYIALGLRAILAFFHPLYCTFALALAPEIAGPGNEAKASSKMLMGVSAGMALGISISAYLAGAFGYFAGMAWFSIPNVIALILVVIYLPDVPGRQNSMASQIGVLKEVIFLTSVVAVIIGMTGQSIPYAYISEFLQSTTHLIGLPLSVCLFAYGAGSFVGNYIAGISITKNPKLTVLISPLLVAAILIGLFVVGSYFIPTFIFVLAFGVSYGIINVVFQYWITSAAPQAPEFANGIYISSTNIGYALAGWIGGIVILASNSRYIMLAGCIVLIISWFFYFIRGQKYGY